MFLYKVIFCSQDILKKVEECYFISSTLQMTLTQNVEFYYLKVYPSEEP